MQLLLEQIQLELQHRNFEKTQVLLREARTLQKRFPHLSLFASQLDSYQNESNLGETSLQNYTEAEAWWRQGDTKKALSCLDKIPPESFLYEVAGQLKKNILLTSAKED